MMFLFPRSYIKITFYNNNNNKYFKNRILNNGDLHINILSFLVLGN